MWMDRNRTLLVENKIEPQTECWRAANRNMHISSRARILNSPFCTVSYHIHSSIIREEHELAFCTPRTTPLCVQMLYNWGYLLSRSQNQFQMGCVYPAKLNEEWAMQIKERKPSNKKIVYSAYMELLQNPRNSLAAWSLEWSQLLGKVEAWSFQND